MGAIRDGFFPWELKQFAREPIKTSLDRLKELKAADVNYRVNVEKWEFGHFSSRVPYYGSFTIIGPQGFQMKVDFFNHLNFDRYNRARFISGQTDLNTFNANGEKVELNPHDFSSELRQQINHIISTGKNPVPLSSRVLKGAGNVGSVLGQSARSLGRALVGR